MEINDNKTERQILGGEKWKYASLNGSIKNGIGTLVYPTGFGKTFTTLLICKKIIDINTQHNNDFTFHITVPSIPLKNQWKESIIDFFNEDVFNTHFKIRVINTVMEALERISCYVSILDEIHEYVTEDRIELLKGNIVISNFKLGLTATYFDNKRVRNILGLYCPVVDYISEQEAIDNNWISNFIEYNLGIDLTPDERKIYNNYSETITEILNKFGEHGFKLATKCLSGAKDENGVFRRNIYWATKWGEANGWKPNLDLNNSKNLEIDEEWNPYVIIQYSKALMNIVKKRKDLLYNSKTKLNTVINVIKKFKDNKIITFSQSTDFAEELTDKLNSKIKKDIAVCYHSSLTPKMLPSPKTGKIIKFGVKRLKDRAIDMFKNNISTVLNSASALDRGFDDKSVEIGITSSGTSNPIQYKQRGGRVKRIDYRSDKKVLLINIYFKNTKDQDWLTSRQFTSIHEIININNINEIKYEIE